LCKDERLTSSTAGAHDGGILWTSGQLWDAKTASYSDYNEPMKPMPLGDKIFVMGVCTFYAPVMAPIWLTNDINYIDVCLRGYDPKEFFRTDKKQYYTHDYIFM
jgi:hypothetical protein